MTESDPSRPPARPQSAASAAPAQSTAPPGDGATPAGAIIRFAARFLDGIAILIITIAAGFVAAVLLAALRFGLGAAVTAGVLVGVFVEVAYYVAFEVGMGATPAKKLLGLRVVGAGGRHPTARESLLRNSFLFVGILSLFGDVLTIAASVLTLVIMIAIAVTINANSAKRGLHDFLGRTAVVRS